MRIQCAAILFVLLVSVLSWLLKMYSQIANPHFAKFHTNFSEKFGSCKIADFHSHFLVLGGSLIIKKKPLTPQAPRSGAKNMAKNDEKPGLLQLGACGSGRFSQPARYRVSCGLEMDVEMLSATFVAFWAPRLGARPSKTPHEVVSWRCRLASGGKLASDPLFTSTRVHSNQSF